MSQAAGRVLARTLSAWKRTLGAGLAQHLDKDVYPDQAFMGSALRLIKLLDRMRQAFNALIDQHLMS